MLQLGDMDEFRPKLRGRSYIQTSNFLNSKFNIQIFPMFLFFPDGPNLGVQDAYPGEKVILEECQQPACKFFLQHEVADKLHDVLRQYAQGHGLQKFIFVLQPKSCSGKILILSLATLCRI
jgi:hypothetical protein